ncbi:hypothetical protein KAI78_06815 [bacterium]|nr:hypothetical protein [bacterium]
MISIGAMIILAVVLALITRVFLMKHKLLSWVLFSAYTAFSVFVLLKLYGNWNYFETMNLSYLVGRINMRPGFLNKPLGWFFSFFVMAMSFLNSFFSMGFSKSSHSRNIVPHWLMILAASLTVFFTKDWLLFIIGWETLGWASFFIIMGGKQKKYKDSMSYYFFSLVSGMLLIAAVWMIGIKFRTLNIHTTTRSMIILAKNTPWQAFPTLLMLTLSFLIKSGAYPFHIWAPRAHKSAPADFSPFISGIMIKFGIFGLLLYVIPIVSKGYAGYSIFGMPVFAWVFSWLGIITSAIATVLAFSENDAKRLMAYSSVANAGYIITAIFLGTALGIKGGLLHAFNHMIFKAVIFMTIAAVVYRTGETDMNKMGGLAYKMPITFMTFLLGIIAAAGIAPMNGFVSKWMIYQALLGQKHYFMTVAMFFASTGAFLYLYRALHAIFLGQIREVHEREVKEVPFLMQIPMWIGMILMFGLGVFPGYLLRPMMPLMKTFGSSISESLNVVQGSVGSLNTLFSTVIFILGVVIAAAIFFLSAKTHKTPMMDNYTSGEDPEEWNVTPNKYQFSYGFYEPITKMFSWALKRSVDKAYFKASYILKIIGREINMIFTDHNNWGYAALLGLLAMIIGGLFL